MARPVVDSPTKADERALRVFRLLYEKAGGPPSVRALADGLGINVSAAHRRLQSCARKGMLVRQPAPGRGWTLPEKLSK